MGRWSWSRHENIRGQEFEEGHPQQGWIGKASEEGQGKSGAVKPMMMNIIQETHNQKTWESLPKFIKKFNVEMDD